MLINKQSIAFPDGKNNMYHFVRNRVKGYAIRFPIWSFF